MPAAADLFTLNPRLARARLPVMERDVDQAGRRAGSGARVQLLSFGCYAAINVCGYRVPAYGSQRESGMTLVGEYA